MWDYCPTLPIFFVRSDFQFGIKGARIHAALPMVTSRERLPGAGFTHISASSSVLNNLAGRTRAGPISSPINCRRAAGFARFFAFGYGLSSCHLKMGSESYAIADRDPKAARAIFHDRCCAASTMRSAEIQKCRRRDLARCGIEWLFRPRQLSIEATVVPSGCKNADSRNVVKS